MENNNREQRVKGGEVLLASKISIQNSTTAEWVKPGWAVTTKKAVFMGSSSFTWVPVSRSSLPSTEQTKQNTMISRCYSTAVKRLYPRPLLSRSPQRVLRRGASNLFRFLNMHWNELSSSTKDWVGQRVAIHEFCIGKHWVILHYYLL